MLTVHATLQPDGHVQLPAALARSRPVPVPVTILEPVDGSTALATPDPATSDNDHVAATLALLRSPAFQALQKVGPEALEQQIRDLRNDWNDA